MASSEMKDITIVGDGLDRIVTCPVCKEQINRSILPHIRQEHKALWEKWREIMLASYNKGLSPKSIMNKHFVVDGRPLFTWSVIEKEIRKMIAEGKDVKCPINRKITKWGPEKFKPEKLTVWKFRSRGNWATHTGSYRGNWPPEVPRNFILRYTNPGETVLDGFVGGGTTIIEARLLGRNAIGVDINPFAIRMTQEQLDVINDEAHRQGVTLPPSEITLKVHDCRDLELPAESIDLICAHPPYFNSVRYTTDQESDISRIVKYDEFLKELGKVASEFYRVLKAGKACAILIGDVKKKGKYLPLGFHAIQIFQEQGFVLEEIIIKEQFRDRSMVFYLNDDELRLNHEYLFVFRKPNGRVRTLEDCECSNPPSCSLQQHRTSGTGGGSDRPPGTRWTA